ncbi:MAG: hypothetical protein U0790_00340 [Isosphaeraceae bacterium]
MFRLAIVIALLPFALVIAGAFLKSIIDATKGRSGDPPAPADPIAGKAAIEPSVDVRSFLVRYKFERRSQPSHYDQFRVIVRPGRYRLREFFALAESLRAAEGSDKAHLHFFDDLSCLENPKGTGLLADSDWPHWLIEVGSVAGRPSTYKIAMDIDTGQTRTDVLKP